MAIPIQPQILKGIFLNTRFTDIFLYPVVPGTGYAQWKG
jgi:hypothetical protein